MRQPTAIGVALRADPTRAGILTALAFVGAAGWMIHCSRPVVAQREYRRAETALVFGADETAREHYEEALAIDPSAVDVRSRFSDLLVNRWNNPSEALTQIGIVRERLNGNELYLREAQALKQLGRETEAKEKYALFELRRGSEIPTP
jgi:tetratricopeptide (TPR) repeat protein